MALAGRNEKHPELRDFSRIPCESANVPAMGRDGHFQIHVEEHGPHWVSWLSRSGETKPDRAVILVAASQEEAEARARKWAEKLNAES